MRSRPWTRREQEVTFHRNGTMSSSDGEKGEWWFDVGGLYWVRAKYAAVSVSKLSCVAAVVVSSVLTLYAV